MKLTNQSQRYITADWHSAFPELGIYKQMHLLRRCGPLLMGICLGRTGGDEAYYPTSHLHCLAIPSPVIMLDLSQRLLACRTLAEESIPVRWHREKWREAASRLMEQALLPHHGPVGLEEIRTALREYMIRFPEGRHSLRIHTISICVLAWARRANEALHAIEVVCEDMGNWPKHVLPSADESREWLHSIRQIVSNHEDLLRTVELETSKHRASLLPTVDTSSWYG